MKCSPPFFSSGFFWDKNGSFYFVILSLNHLFYSNPRRKEKKGWEKNVEIRDEKYDLKGICAV